jgi:hypothetical protein
MIFYHPIITTFLAYALGVGMGILTVLLVIISFKGSYTLLKDCGLTLIRYLVHTKIEIRLVKNLKDEPKTPI